MVISFFLTIGNYDYGFYWYLYLDGTIQLEVEATGVVFASGYRAGDQLASEMAPGLGAPFHQHVFSARLDAAHDGGHGARPDRGGHRDRGALCRQPPPGAAAEK